MKNKYLFSLSSLSFSLGILSLFGLLILNENKDSVNKALGIDVSKIVNEGDSSSSIYFSPTIGDKSFSDENFLFLEEECRKQTIKEEQEGAVLLYNKENALPLVEEKSITLLGHGSFFPVYKANSAGNYVTEEREGVINLENALKNDSFSVNEKMAEEIKKGKAGYKTITFDKDNSLSAYSFMGAEEPSSFYEERKDLIDGYQDCCIITFTRTGGEGIDLYCDDFDDDGITRISSLALHQNERDLLSFARRNFKKVIVLLNSPNQMEVEEIKKYSDAILAIGQPGLTGFQGVADILCGKVNPSGRLADTYAVNSLSSPAVVNSSTRTPLYGNVLDFNKDLRVKEKAKLASFQAENIYVGYKYYETRYEDCVKKRFQASNSVGSSGFPSWNYKEEVSYPFGYGLSYSTFEEEILSFEKTKDEITLKVQVTNTSPVKGKDVVEVYASTPYSEYEMENGVEKSSVVLVGFAKTKELKRDERETLEIKIDPYLLSSYDEKNKKTFYLSKGDYYLSIGKDSHDALNAILSYQNLDGLIDQDGIPYQKKENQVVSFFQDFDFETYSKTGNQKITNLFSSCDLKNLSSQDVTYLSRKDWKNTFPKEKTIVIANDKMKDVLMGDFYQKDETKKRSIFERQEKGIPLISMKGISLSDPLWDTFLSQASLEDLSLTTAESFHCPAISSLSSPMANTGDGMDSLGLSYELKDGRKVETNTYACKNVLTCTFNSELYFQRGLLMGNESLFCKSFENYCIGGNLHRTPFGGRNFEYMSEDSNLSYLASIPEVQAMESVGVYCAPKHFAGNDQETGREGVSVFFNEQAFRENDLRGFEGALKKAKCHGVMQSFERCGLVFASSCKELNTELLRGEWGFSGNIVSDATYGAISGYKGHVREILSSGTNQFCLDYNATAGKRIVKYIKEEKDETLFYYLYETAKNFEYLLCNSIAMNSIAKTTKIITLTPWWYSLTLSFTISFFSLGLLLLLFYFLRENKIRTKE